MSSSQVRTARLAVQQRGTTGSESPAPVVLGRYRLHVRLGAGAFGTVWMARDERLERDVAVKILPRERIVGGRFEREARATARLAHPGIVTLYEAAIDDEGAYLVSELVRGPTFAELLGAGRLSDRDIVAVGIALCDALVHAHQQGVVHRDVKPSNILVPEQPASPSQLAKLTDFGVARVVGGDSLTLTGDVIGTLAYMAPEQAEGRETGAGADLYSLALVLYEALTGVNPVRVGTAAQRARRLGAYLPPLRRQRRDLPRELGQGIDLALRPRPRERGTVTEFRRALIAALHQVGDEPGIVSAPWARREPGSQDGEPPAVDRGQVPATARPDDPPAARSATAGPDDLPAAHKPSLPGWPARGLAALAAAATAGWLSTTLLSPAPLAPAAACLLAAALTLILPRVGWLALACAACAVAVAQDRGGGAVLVLIAMLTPVLLLPRRPTAWPLAAGAPALGLLGLAGAWPALAAQAATPWRRAATAVAGWIFLLLATPLANRTLYLAKAPGTTSANLWLGSPYDTAHHLLAPLLSSGALAVAPVWALAATVLPWLVWGRVPALDVVRALLWAAMLVTTTVVVLAVVHPSGGLHAPTAALGAAAAAAVAVAPSILAALRGKDHAARSAAGFP